MEAVLVRLSETIYSLPCYVQGFFIFTNMQISQDLLNVLEQGYSAGGEPELARQLAIGNDLISEYVIFRRSVWREWGEIVSELYTQKYFINGYKYVNIDLFIDNAPASFIFNYDQRSIFLPKLISAFIQGFTLKIYISICHADYFQDSRAILYKHNIGIAIEKIAKTLNYISIEAFYQNSLNR